MIRDAEVWLTPEREEDRWLPEGPREVTLGGREAIAWVNIQTAADATTGAIFARYWDTGEVRRFDLPDRPGFFLPTDRPDTLLVGAGKRLMLFQPLTGDIEELATIPDENPRTIINDGEVVPGGGAVVFGTKDVRFADPIAHLYLFDLSSARLSVLADEQTCSNGKVFLPPDGQWAMLADIDTPQRRIDHYAVELRAGHLGGVGDGVCLLGVSGFPDGMVNAGDGSVLVAFYDPEPVGFGVVRRFDMETGAPLPEVWRVPGSPRVTCPLLVRRPDGVKLILTTAVEGMPAEQRAASPNAGCLFIADADGLDPPAAEVVRLSSPTR